MLVTEILAFVVAASAPLVSAAPTEAGDLEQKRSAAFDLDARSFEAPGFIEARSPKSNDDGNAGGSQGKTTTVDGLSITQTDSGMLIKAAASQGNQQDSKKKEVGNKNQEADDKKKEVDGKKKEGAAGQNVKKEADDKKKEVDSKKKEGAAGPAAKQNVNKEADDKKREGAAGAAAQQNVNKEATAQAKGDEVEKKEKKEKKGKKANKEKKANATANAVDEKDE